MLKSFAKDLVSALSYCHANGIIYCDLKPSNILLNEYSCLKLCDFGLSKKLVDLVQGEESCADIDREGTPYYMSPELFDQKGIFSFASDIYALGAVLYELACGKTPFTDENFTELVSNICENKPEKLYDVSEDCNDFIMRLLEKNPARRPKWPQVMAHAWWAGIEFQEYELPDETHFEKYINEKGYNKKALEVSQDMTQEPANQGGRQEAQNPYTENSELQKASGLSGSNINKEENLLRMSINVKKNINRDTGEYIDPKDENQDIKLDKNMTINMGKKMATQLTSELQEEGQNKSQDTISQVDESRSKAGKSLRSHKSFE